MFCFTMSSQMCLCSSFADAGTIIYCMEKLLSSWDCNVWNHLKIVKSESRQATRSGLDGLVGVKLC